jgi:hypothetical protein
VVCTFSSFALGLCMLDTRRGCAVMGRESLGGLRFRLSLAIEVMRTHPSLSSLHFFFAFSPFIISLFNFPISIQIPAPHDLTKPQIYKSTNQQPALSLSLSPLPPSYHTTSPPFSTPLCPPHSNTHLQTHTPTSASTPKTSTTSKPPSTPPSTY